MSLPGDPFSISCKLPRSSDEALSFSFTTATAYGLGKSGWVSANLDADAAVPVDLFKAWIDESYRAQAPKRLSAKLPPLPSDLTDHASQKPAKRVPSKKTPSKKTPTKKTP
jgi:predicted DNA-binding protein (MmcQ/YjbR family)